MDNQVLLLFAFIYAAFLFFIAWRAQGWQVNHRWFQPLLYSFSLAVYCSSWTFLGAVGQAVDSGWSFLPIYLGPIIVFIFGWPMLRWLLVVSSRNKVTSIADFIGSRYGKSQLLAAVVTLVAVAGSLPYIALQLKAVALVWSTINVGNIAETVELKKIVTPNGTGLITALIMACFAILFGTRIIEGPRRHQGMITAVALESLIKLIAFFAISVLALSMLGNVELSLVFSSSALSSFSAIDLNFFTQLLLAMMAIICLPRQFHVMAIEYRNSRDIRMARWLFPFYLALFSLLIIPIALAGQQLLSDTYVSVDAVVLLLPMLEHSAGYTALAFIGALSAATGMVVVAAVTLSIMISNELVVPMWLWLSSKIGGGVNDLGSGLRLVRRLSIVVVLLLAWLLDLSFGQSHGLADIGLISFAAAGQLMPAIFAGLYWPHGHRNGVLAGLFFGSMLWFYCLLLPALLGEQHLLIVQGPWGVRWLSPVSFVGTGFFMDTLSHGVFWSLLLNSLVFYCISKLSRFNTLDLRQAAAFTQLRRQYSFRGQDFELTDIEVRQLQTLLQPLLGNVRDLKLWCEFEQRLGHRLLPHDKAPRFVVKAVEQSMASIVGAVSAHRAIELTSRQLPVQIEDFVSLVGGHSRQLQFSQELLQTSLETISQGISVVDNQLQLVAWNKRYQELFGFPERLLYVGCPIARVYRYNAERGFLEEGCYKSIDEIVERRLQQLREGKEHRYESRLVNSTVLEILGKPMANGGYVTTYTDITDYQHILDELEQTKTRLEDRVAERTAELFQVNESLRQENVLRAKIEQELKTVHTSKSRFLAAASHDLLQPINAARLFVATLQQKSASGDIAMIEHDINHIDGALASVENLIDSMREIARLDSGKLTPRRDHFPIGLLLSTLAGEFSVLAERGDLKFRWVNSTQWVYTDQYLLRRVLQNFLSNALRYTRRGTVLLGCRRCKEQILVEVWDTGPGIAYRDRKRIFDEFERLADTSSSDGQKGLGLGLSIASRIAQLLGHKMDFNSWLGAGSVFRIRVPLGQVQQRQKQISDTPNEMQGVMVLCIDNELRILAGMQALLEQWGCKVTCATTLGEALQRWPESNPPDVVLADYHLDVGENGLDVLQALSYHWDSILKAVVISANNTGPLRKQVRQAGYLFLAKPLQPGSLRSAMRRLVRSVKQAY